ncbi:hypothetical protein I204_08300 [Kwoniella mangroviensis CBS 8886]|nr:hypothetical protein I204_08300 [Kwoniella mangroviensis CBS 8886]
MSMTTLPPSLPDDILQHILALIRSDPSPPPSLLNVLCRTSKSLYRKFIPILYNHLDLSSQKTLGIFEGLYLPPSEDDDVYFPEREDRSSVLTQLTNRDDLDVLSSNFDIDIEQSKLHLLSHTTSLKIHDIPSLKTLSKVLSIYQHSDEVARSDNPRSQIFPNLQSLEFTSDCIYEFCVQTQSSSSKYHDILWPLVTGLKPNTIIFNSPIWSSHPTIQRFLENADEKLLENAGFGIVVHGDIPEEIVSIQYGMFNLLDDIWWYFPLERVVVNGVVGMEMLPSTRPGGCGVEYEPLKKYEIHYATRQDLDKIDCLKDEGAMEVLKESRKMRLKIRLEDYHEEEYEMREDGEENRFRTEFEIERYGIGRKGEVSVRVGLGDVLEDEEQMRNLEKMVRFT